MWKKIIIAIIIVYLCLTYRYVNRIKSESILTIEAFNKELLKERIPLYIKNIDENQLQEFKSGLRIQYNKKRELSLRKSYCDGIVILPETDKVIFLFNNLQTSKLYPLYDENIFNDWEIKSRVNPLQPSDEFKKYNESEYTTVVIKKGDAFIVPFGWWYMIENDDDTVKILKWNDYISIPFKMVKLLYDKFTSN